MNKKSLTSFFTNDLPAYASYDNVRKIPSYIDGMKMSQRKVVFTLLKKYPKEFVKTETLANITAAFTNYLHGAQNIATAVCTTMTQNFVGANNYPLTTGNSGGWGCRINPNAAAPRYTRLCLSDITKKLINPDDDTIVGQQFFEGDYIEPKYFVPVFPLLLLNGSNGLSTGFSCTIYPRKPENVLSYIRKRLKGVAAPKEDLAPWFKGFKGSVRYNETAKVYESVGVIKQDNTTKLTISELPIGLSYQKYVEFLDKLYEDKVITDYDDLCEPKTDEIRFVVKMSRASLAKKNQQDLEKMFKMTRLLPENLNCVDENNRVREFSSVEEILEAYIAVRRHAYTERKAFLVTKHQTKLDELISKLVFCDGVIKGDIKVAKVSKAKIEAQLEKVKRIIKVDGSYDYLLRMPIYSISAEKMEELKKAITELSEKLRKTRETSEEDMWLEDIKDFKRFV